MTGTRIHRLRTTRGGVRAGARPAFTFVEFIVVMILAGILGVAAAISFDSLPTGRRAAAAAQIRDDLAYARERAMASGVRHWVVFTVPSNSYSVLAEDPSSPGRAGATTITDPATLRPLVQSLGEGASEGASITSAVFDAGAEVGFDWLGRPVQSSLALLASDGVVQCAGGHQIVVHARTGMVTHDAP